MYLHIYLLFCIDLVSSRPHTSRMCMYVRYVHTYIASLVPDDEQGANVPCEAVLHVCRCEKQPDCMQGAVKLAE